MDDLKFCANDRKVRRSANSVRTGNPGNVRPATAPRNKFRFTCQTARRSQRCAARCNRVPGHPSFFLRPCEGGRAPRGASSWDPRDQNRGFHLRPVHAARIRLAECGSPIGAPPRCLKSGTVLPGSGRDCGIRLLFREDLGETWGLRRYLEPIPRMAGCHHPSPDRSTSSTSTTADPGNRRGRTMTRPPKDPGCPGPLGTAPAPSPNVFRKTPLWRERDNQYYAFLF